ncbi:IS3 family transposase [Streptococcus constellatus]|uniref:IS3 family transposase n=1 Tax=Streptococcus constellatus TaxID=76860 RepID=UPI0036F38FEA
MNWNCLREHFYTATKSLFTPRKLITKLAQKKASPAICPRKGTPADHACIEWFHSVLKSETFYLHNWRNLTKDSITDIGEKYITFYNESRIQQRLNDQSPTEYRRATA